MNRTLGDDYFFNRISLKNCVSIEDVLKITRKKIQGLQDCYIHVQKNDVVTLNILRKLGATKFGSMEIMSLQAELFSPNVSKNNISINSVSLDNLQLWIDVFCRSFGILNIKEEITKLSMGVFNSSIPIMAICSDGRITSSVGCCTLFEKCGGMGLYCLGTLQEYRHMGVGTALVKACVGIARTNGYNCIFVQTLVNEGLVKFYMNLGFKQAYEKSIFVLNG
ncbi:MAG: GNAT family N-acetyltransferase [Thermoproteota archaeon]|nr:GNAT family N-acetyltransferase [Thermoproteota archaeon]